MSSWNISKSIEHLSTHVESKSVGRCARYVRQAIEAGGLDTNGHPGSAYQYKRYLPTKGFNAIGNITGREKQAAWTKLNAQVGDISVMEHGEHGHICMWNGSKWISDFAQNNMWPYRGDGTCTIFRFGGHVDGNLEPYNGKISSNPNATNIGAQRVYENVGFKLEGTHRQERVAGGRFEDRLYYGLLANEFDYDRMPLQIIGDSTLITENIKLGETVRKL